MTRASDDVAERETVLQRLCPSQTLLDNSGHNRRRARTSRALWLVALIGVGCATTGRDTARVEPTLARPGRQTEAPAAVVPLAATGQVPASPIPTVALPLAGAPTPVPIVPAAPPGALSTSATQTPLATAPQPAPAIVALPAPPVFTAGTGSSFVPAAVASTSSAGAPLLAGPVPGVFPAGQAPPAAAHSMIVSGFLSGSDIAGLGLRLHPKPAATTDSTHPLIPPPAP